MMGTESSAAAFATAPAPSALIRWAKASSLSAASTAVKAAALTITSGAAARRAGRIVEGLGEIEARATDRNDGRAHRRAAFDERSRDLALRSCHGDAHQSKKSGSSARRGCLRSFVREDHLIGGDPPIDAERRIVPCDAVVVLGRIIIRHFVENLGIGFERHIAVREADRNKNLPPIVGGKSRRPHAGRRSKTICADRRRRRGCGRASRARACPERKAEIGNAGRAMSRGRPRRRGCPARIPE